MSFDFTIRGHRIVVTAMWATEDGYWWWIDNQGHRHNDLAALVTMNLKGGLRGVRCTLAAAIVAYAIIDTIFPRLRR